MKFLKHKKGFSIGSLIVFIIGIVIAVTVIPIATTAITASKENFTSSQQTLLDLIPTILVVALLIGGLSIAGIGYAMK